MQGAPGGRRRETKTRRDSEKEDRAGKQTSRERKGPREREREGGNRDGDHEIGIRVGGENQRNRMKTQEERETVEGAGNEWEE